MIKSGDSMKHAKSNRLTRLSRSILLAAVVTLAGTANAEIPIAESPLATSTSVEPNVMFIIDDSGSMHWEHMPDGTLVPPGGVAVRYMFPRRDGIYLFNGDGDFTECESPNAIYSNTIPRFDADNDQAAFYRSPPNPFTQPRQNNAVYYNPANTYPPWRNADGSSFPDAPPTAAPNLPTDPDMGTRNLVADLNERARWINNDGTETCENNTYYPATYFYPNQLIPPGSERDADLYDRIEIRPGNAPFAGHGRDNRTDCGAGNSCTYAEEVQNFANWYSYYRSRNLAARGGLGVALVEQPNTMRVGYGTLNKGNSRVDGEPTRSILLGVRKFEGTDKAEFYEQLYNRPNPQAGTPLRLAMARTGAYFQRSDNRGPWGRTPGSDDSTPQLECRKSFNILMTDGFRNGGSPDPAFGNEDGENGPLHTDPEGNEGQYIFSAPFTDGNTNSLADAAMAFYKNDLRPNMANRVASSQRNPAFWQHLVTYGVGFGVQGNINPDDAFDAIETGATINWGDPDNDSAARIDDLLHAGVNTRGGFFSASDPASFAREFDLILQDIIARSRSTSSLSTASTRLTTESLVFEGSFDSNDWSGNLTARNLDGTLEWRASESLPAPTARNIFTINNDGTGGLVFNASNVGTLSSVLLDLQAALLNIHSAQLILFGGTFSPQDLLAHVVNYVRGDVSQELRSGGYMRNRVSLLGDVVNSQPEFYGIRNEGWQRLDEDYDSFLDDEKTTNPRMVYVAGNDGMLHGYFAGRDGGGFQGGQELFAYVPKSIISKLPQLTDQNYAHTYYVDATPRLADARGSGGWTTVLVGSTGAGARSVFALDVGNPDSFNASDVLWELSDADDPDLGHVLNQSVITRINDGRWVAIFGNGYNSVDEDGVLFVVDLFSGEIIRKLETGFGDTVNPAGLGAPRVEMDPDTGLFAANVYVGDLQGNLWKFDVSATSPNSWSSAFGTNANPVPLFTAEGPNGNVQPITAAPTIARTPQGGVYVYFGTGRFFAVGDNLVDANSTAIESFYTVFDDGTDEGLERDDLVDIDITGEFVQDGSRVRTFANETVAIDSNIRGYRIDLEVDDTVTGERIISTPRVTLGVLIFASFEPSQDACIPGGTPRLYVLSAIDGSGNLSPSNDCLNCGSIELDPGGPVDPPIVIAQPPAIDPDDPCFDNPGAAGCEDFNPNPTDPFGSSRIVFIDPITGERTGIGVIRDGRVAWGQKIEY